jgi:hypothetical protein
MVRELKVNFGMKIDDSCFPSIDKVNDRNLRMLFELDKMTELVNFSTLIMIFINLRICHGKLDLLEYYYLNRCRILFFDVSEDYYCGLMNFLACLETSI